MNRSNDELKEVFETEKLSNESKNNELPTKSSVLVKNQRAKSVPNKKVFSQLVRLVKFFFYSFEVLFVLDFYQKHH